MTDACLPLIAEAPASLYASEKGESAAVPPVASSRQRLLVTRSATYLFPPRTSADDGDVIPAGLHRHRPCRLSGRLRGAAVSSGVGACVGWRCRVAFADHRRFAEPLRGKRFADRRGCRLGAYPSLRVVGVCPAASVVSSDVRVGPVHDTAAVVGCGLHCGLCESMAATRVAVQGAVRARVWSVIAIRSFRGCGLRWRGRRHRGVVSFAAAGRRPHAL